jgi:hypothetical protein
MASFVNGLITIVSVLAAVAAMILITYLFTFLADKILCVQSAIMTAEELEARRHASTLTIKAGLAGLLKEERDQVFRTFFEKQSFPYHEGGERKVGKVDEITVDLEAQADYGKEDDQSHKTEHPDFDPSDKVDETHKCDDPLDAVQAVDTADEDVGGPTCSICLNVYGKEDRCISCEIVASISHHVVFLCCTTDESDKVILGSACAHMFHYDCCMQWVEKGNEECPYCRKNMISPNEFYQTAVEVVGLERVEKLKRINQEAAARVASLAAAGQVNISHPVPS